MTVPPGALQAITFTTLTPTGNHAAIASVQAPRYFQDALGFVHIEGTTLTNGTIAALAPLFSNTLPTAMRPAAWQSIQLQSIAQFVLYVRPDGTIITAGALAAGYVLCFGLVFTPLI
jgi:hypothetical protein